MEKIARTLVRSRWVAFAATIAAALVCTFFAFSLKAETDLAKYLPEDSEVRRGLTVNEKEFPKDIQSSAFRVAFEDKEPGLAQELYSELAAIPYVDSVEYDPQSDRFNRNGKLLFILKSRYGYDSGEAKSIEAEVNARFTDRDPVFQSDGARATDLPPWLIPSAVAMAAVILIIMSKSWLDPVLILVSTGLAILINAGTNALLPSTSQMTVSVAPVIQLVLSMDYSIMFIDRYRSERKRSEISEAMRKTITGAAGQIISSSLTTVFGLLALTLFSFKLGPELGIALAKGVFISMVCVFTVLPTLTAAFDNTLKKAAKAAPSIRTQALASFSYKARKAMPFVFAVFLIASFTLQLGTGVEYTDKAPDKLENVFPKSNDTVIIYENRDSAKAAEMIRELSANPCVTQINAYESFLGVKKSAEEMREMFAGMFGVQLPETLAAGIYALKQTDTMTADEFAAAFADATENGEAASPGMREQAKKLKTQIGSAVRMLKGNEHSRIIISAQLPAESDATSAFIQELRSLCEKYFEGEYMLTGESAMAEEMSETFGSEYLKISLLTAAAVFLVIFLTFRGIALPILLTITVESAVFFTAAVIGLTGGSMYFMALLIVQSILMGATIDYGIIFCTHYREQRRTEDIRGALKTAYSRSAHTVLTSGSVLVVVLAVLGSFSQALTAQVCRTLSLGALASILLILLVLPSLTAAADRSVAGRR